MATSSGKKIRTRRRKKRSYFTSLEFKWAVIITLFYLFWSIVQYELGVEDGDVQDIIWAAGLVQIPIFLLYVLGISDKKKNYFGGKLKYKHGFKTGFGITVFTALLSPLIQLVIHKVVFPKFFNEAILYSEKNHLLSTEHATSLFNMNTFIGLNLLLTVVFGVIFSVIAALILKNRRG